MTPESLDARLQALETDCSSLRRANARWRRLCAAAIAASGALVLMGQGGARGQPVTAEAFKLVKDGKVRAQLAVDDSDQVSLGLRDGEQRVRALFSVKADGNATFSFVDPDGSIRATFSQDASGKPGLALLEKSGAKRATLGAEPAGLLVYDNAGSPKAAILCAGEGKGILQVRDAAGKPTFNQ